MIIKQTLKQVADRALEAAHEALSNTEGYASGARRGYLAGDEQGNTDKQVRLAAALINYEATIEAAKITAGE